MNDAIDEKARKWIADGKDPRSAHWQGGLEAVLNVFLPYLEPGRLTPAVPLEEDAVAVFNEVLEAADLSPNIYGAFLPPPVAGKITPPASAPELQRIEAGQPSFKILVYRPADEPRIACFEVSPHASKCGVDLFQAGALLGTYDFEDRAECLSNFSKIVRAHLWEKGQWRSEDYRRYTVNWFERVVDLHKASVSVQEDFSFFHTPSLIKSNRIDAMFTLIDAFFEKLSSYRDAPFREWVEPIRSIPDEAGRAAQFKEMADKTVLQLLTVIKDLDLMDFGSFSETETKQFKHESDRAVQRIARKLASI